MTKEQLVKIIQDEATVETLYKGEAYIIEIEVGDMPKETVKNYLEGIGNRLNTLGLGDVLLVPTNNGLGTLKFYQIKNRHLFEFEDK